LNGFEVLVHTRFLPEQSAPREARFAFAYTITIENHGAASAQLLNRHWRITDGEGGVQEVRGEGVVGQQPVIPPGRAFRYTSGCVLSTPVGTMEGEYEFEGEDGGRFEVSIPCFLLAQPNQVH
jgi:ApaG protein